MDRVYQMSAWRDPILINTIGHTAGVLLFGIIIALLVRDSRIREKRQTRLPLIAAALAFGWNLGSLIGLGLVNENSLGASLVATASFAALSLLPAVLLQVVLHGKHGRLVLTGYAVSAAAVAIHISERAPGSPVWHQAALIVVASGFGTLVITAFLLRTEWIRLASLLLFALSFLHFAYEHGKSPWPAEIAWHHIGIPAILIILLHDYRLLLLDTFVRFLINFGLSALYLFAAVTTVQNLQLRDADHLRSFAAGLTLVILCLSLVLFTYWRNYLQTWVSRAIFRRPDLETAISRIGTAALSSSSEAELLQRAAEEVARFVDTEHAAIEGETAPADQPSSFRAVIRIPLRFSGENTCLLVVGARKGGRRYLSEDVEALRRLAAAISSQLERFRADELKYLASRAELRALQAQMNPHFLFNSLNALYGTIDRQSVEARQMVLNLAELLRYLLKDNRAMVRLGEELRIVQAYLAIESLRLGERLQTELLVSESAKAAAIPVLSIQPLVENAIRHGVEGRSGRGKICVRADQTSEGVLVSVTDSGSGILYRKEASGAGVALENVRRRLTLCYGSAAYLNLESSEAGTRVEFFVPSHAFPIGSPASTGELAAGRAHESIRSWV